MNLRGRLYVLDTPRVMGILNATPDSFYSGSRVQSEKDIVERAAQMIDEGAHFLDVGGYSTRPGASQVTEEEERRRLRPAIDRLVKEFPDTPLSVDTFRADIAREAIDHGASLINDVTGGEGDPRMMEVVASLGVPYVLMHMRGTPETMNTLTHYDDLILEITRYFQEKIYRLRSLGVRDIVLDPGFGFAKNVAQNFELLNHLDWFREVFRLPLLVGLSRKSMIWRTLETTPEEALNGTTGLHMLALRQGAAILRVHDVKPAVECIALHQKTNQTFPA